jgi:hypothetical protein
MSPGPRKEWFPFTVRNAAFFHAVIGSTASLLAYKKNVEADNVDYFYHRGQAISLVNKAISDGDAATENVIATVAVFIQQDVRFRISSGTYFSRHIRRLLPPLWR